MQALRNSRWKPENEEERCYTGVAIGCGLSFTEELANAGMLLVSFRLLIAPCTKTVGNVQWFMALSRSGLTNHSARVNKHVLKSMKGLRKLCYIVRLQDH